MFRLVIGSRIRERLSGCSTHVIRYTRDTDTVIGLSEEGARKEDGRGKGSGVGRTCMHGTLFGLGQGGACRGLEPSKEK